MTQKDLGPRPKLREADEKFKGRNDQGLLEREELVLRCSPHSGLPAPGHSRDPWGPLALCRLEGRLSEEPSSFSHGFSMNQQQPCTSSPVQLSRKMFERQQWAKEAKSGELRPQTNKQKRYRIYMPRWHYITITSQLLCGIDKKKSNFFSTL